MYVLLSFSRIDEGLIYILYISIQIIIYIYLCHFIIEFAAQNEQFKLAKHNKQTYATEFETFCVWKFGNYDGKGHWLWQVYMFIHQHPSPPDDNKVILLYSHLDVGKRCPVVCLQTTFSELIAKLAVAVNQNRSKTAWIIQSSSGKFAETSFPQSFRFSPIQKMPWNIAPESKPPAVSHPDPLPHSSSLKGAGGFSGTTGSWNT